MTCDKLSKALNQLDQIRLVVDFGMFKNIRNRYSKQ